jgi:hypothetical protein
MVSDKVRGPTWSGSTVVINPCNCSDLRSWGFVLPLARCSYFLPRHLAPASYVNFLIQLVLLSWNEMSDMAEVSIDALVEGALSLGSSPRPIL